MYTFKKSAMKYKNTEGNMVDVGAVLGQIGADAVLSETSTNPIQNKVVKEKFDSLDEIYLKKSEVDDIDLSAYESTENAQAKLEEAKNYSDDNLDAAKTYSDNNLKTAKSHADTNFTTLKNYTDGLNDTVNASISAANEAIEQKTRIEFIIWEETD